MSIENELNQIQSTKDNLADSIINKGQSVISTDTLSSYSDKIKLIENHESQSIYLLKEVLEGTVTKIEDTTCTILRSNCLQFCKQLESAKFTNLRKICNFSFMGCFKLKQLILTSNKMVYLTNPNAFRYTLLEKLNGIIYVPNSLINTYKQDTNWKKFATIIKSI